MNIKDEDKSKIDNDDKNGNDINDNTNNDEEIYIYKFDKYKKNLLK